MAFPTGWSHKFALTIDADYVDSDLTDFTVLVSDLVVPTGFWDEVKDGGGDIRASSDSAGSTQLPVDVRICDVSGEVLDLAVKVSAISSSTDTTIYIWIGKADESQPAVNDTYGQYNAYDGSFKGVYAFHEDPSGSAPQMLDRTSNAKHGTTYGTMTSGDSVSTANGRGLDHDGTDDQVQFESNPLPAYSSAMTMSCLVYPNDTGNQGMFQVYGYDSGDGLFLLTRAASGSVRYILTPTGGSADLNPVTGWSLTSGAWQHLAFCWSGSSIYAFRNGTISSNSASATGTIGTSTQFVRLRFGGGTGSGSEYYLDGQSDEVRVSNVARSAAWLKAEYYNHLNAATFASPGSLTAVSSGTDIDATTGTVEISGLIASVSVGTTIGAATTTVEIIGLPATVALPTNIDVGTATSEISGLPASVSVGASISTVAGTVEIVGLSATVLAGTSIESVTSQVIITGLAADVSVGTFISSTIGSVSISPINAVVSLGVLVQSTTDTLVITGLQASVSSATVVSATTGSLSISGSVAIVSPTVSILASVGNLTITGLTASLSTSLVVAATTGTVSIVGAGADVSVSSAVSTVIIVDHQTIMISL